MKKGLLLSLFILFYSLSVSSQINRHGTPLVSWFDAAETPGDLRNLSVTMDGRGVMYFGNEAGGILTYDGSEWGLIRTPGTGKVTVISTDTRGIVFAGGENDFGFLEPDLNGRLTWRSLKGMITDSAGADQLGGIVSIAADSSGVFFTDGQRLCMLATGSDSVTIADLEAEVGLRAVSLLYAFDKKIIIADNAEGLFAFSKGTVTSITGGDRTGNSRFVKILAYDRDNLLIADTGKGLMLFNIKTGTLTDKFADSRGRAIMRAGKISDLVSLPGNVIAVGLSDKGGVCIFSHEGKLLQLLSEQTTSVRESSVTAMYCDNSSNSLLWFCTNGFINRAYISLPASEFGSSAGITSVTGPILGFADSIFAGTEDGLYKNHIDRSGVMRFRRIRNPGLRVNDLIAVEISDEKALLASTPGGLLQIDSEGDATRFLNKTYFTSIRTDGNNPAVMVAGSPGGTVRTLRYEEDEWIVTNTLTGYIRGAITDIEQSAPGEWWIVTEAPSSLVRMLCEPGDTTFVSYGRAQGLGCDTINSISVFDDMLIVCTGKGLYRYNRQNDALEKDHELAGSNFDNASISLLFRTPDKEIVLSGFDTRNFDALVTTTRQGPVVFRRQFDFLPDIATSGIAWIDGSIWLAKGRSLFVLDKSKLAFRYGAFSTIFTRITSGNNILMDGTFFTEGPDGSRIPSLTQPDKPRIRLRHSNNGITFRWSATSYVGENHTEYRHRLDGFDDDWSGWEARNYRDYTNLPSGDYTFILKARTITGLEGDEQRFSFTIWKPWYTSLLARLFYFAVISFLVFNIIRYFARRLRIRNSRLDSLLRQRNEATARGKDEIAGMEKYAGIIQQALQASERNLSEVIPNSFILNMPKGAVSGDFFWMTNRGESTIMAVGDCTGHSVPSSLRTVMAQSFLDDICRSPSALTTAAILRAFRKKLSDTFRTLPESEMQQEGIDISVLSINNKKKTVEYSGAASQCFRVREMNDQELKRWKNGEFKPNEGTIVSGKHLLETVYGDRIPLGMHLDGDHEFTQHTWKLDKESSYYLLTDGYSDQFNGITGKKFLKRNLRKLMLDISSFPMSKQREILVERLGSWMGKSPQTDDILIVGLRIE